MIFFVCDCCFLYVFVTQFRPELFARLESDEVNVNEFRECHKTKKPVPDLTVIHVEIFTEGHFTSLHTQKPNTSSPSKHPSVSNTIIVSQQHHQHFSPVTFVFFSLLVKVHSCRSYNVMLLCQFVQPVNVPWLIFH